MSKTMDQLWHLLLRGLSNHRALINFVSLLTYTKLMVLLTMWTDHGEGYLHKGWKHIAISSSVEAARNDVLINLVPRTVEKFG